jgi:8-oxo-dGTP pyrophosphatase MutT (NUDIX family)
MPQQSHKSRKLVTNRRVGQAVIFDDSGKFVLMVQENNYAKKWGFPKGGIKREDDNSFVNCARREVKEETGLDISRWNCTKVCNQLGKHTFVFRTNLRPSVNINTDPKEILECEWVHIDFVRSDVRDNPSKYNLSCRIALQHI